MSNETRTGPDGSVYERGTERFPNEYRDFIPENNPEQVPDEIPDPVPDAATEQAPPEPSDGGETGAPRKRFSLKLSKRLWVALGCIGLALILCFGIAPLIARGSDAHVKVVRVGTFVKAGERILESDLVTVEVGGYRLPGNALKSAGDAVGKYAVSDLYPGDYLFPEKLSANGETDARTDVLLSGESMALSLGLNSYASGLSGKLRRGDVVTVMAYDTKNGYSFLPAELQSVLVLACTTPQGKDLTGTEPDAGQPATLTLLVTAAQAQRLIELDKSGSLTYMLRCSGRDAERAEQLLSDQARVLAGGNAHG